MNSDATIIYGKELHEGRSTAEQLLSSFYNAFNNKDLDTIASIWLQAEESVAQNPSGGLRRGWLEIRKVYETIFKAAAIITADFHDYSIHQAVDIFYVVGQEKVNIRSTEKNFTVWIRISRIFKKIGTEWKQVHLHGSIDDVKLLQEYQKITSG